MKKYVLDFTDKALRYELHLEIKKKLGFPQWYGKNLDALNDLLGEINEPTEITVVGAEHLRSFFGYYGESLISVLEKSNPSITIKTLP